MSEVRDIRVGTRTTGQRKNLDALPLDRAT